MKLKMILFRERCCKRKLSIYKKLWLKTNIDKAKLFDVHGCLIQIRNEPKTKPRDNLELRLGVFF